MRPMTEPTPEAVDTFLSELVARDDEALMRARRASDEAGLPSIAVSAPHGKFLRVLARTVGARRILEIGTLGGYSTIWLAGGVAPGGPPRPPRDPPKHAP